MHVRRYLDFIPLDRLGCLCLKVVGGFLLLMMISPVVEGHAVEQFYVDVQPEKKQLLVNFDVGYAIAETRDDPNESQPTREWLVARTDTEHEAFREEAELYLRSGIRFVSEGEVVSYQVKFPDFIESPYSFPKLLNRGAYYNVALVPERWDASVLVELLEGSFPKLVLAFPGTGQGEFSFETLDAGGELSLKIQGAAVGETSVEVSSFWQLLKLGFRHVIPDGVDHILFILGMCLMANSLRNLLWQSAVFTVAHSVSMGLVVAGWLPIYAYSVSGWIEPVIALSIVLIAVESILKKRSLGWRYGSIGLFGLVHGLGFAGSLGSALQFVIEGDWLRPLLISNLGIELAQVLVVVIAFSLLCYFQTKLSEKCNSLLRVSIALGVATVGVVWFVQRVG